ncbi:protein FAR1-RELATED SEQUENCE 1-like [Silene latifolia]|uniref:protein FAR1-RELATED SEQUENCE 1-like n=1 Tax=Silene latifolia TaxID=37657 RepID=UPI003D77DD0B
MPKTLFESNWEAHAVKVYTLEVFFEFQEEVKFSVNACSVCGYTPLDPVTNFEVSIVEDANKRKRYVVEYNRRTLDVRCTCKLFERKGILCNHIIWICSGKFKEITEKYILRRWSKNALRNPVYDLNGNLLENYDPTGNSKFRMSWVWYEIYATVGMLKGKEESDMREFAKLIKEFREVGAKPKAFDQRTRIGGPSQLQGSKRSQELTT